jgi:hypothetical protein
MKASPDANIGISAQHLKSLARTFGVTADTMLHPLPVLDNNKTAAVETAKLLWDRLYPDLESFAVAVLTGSLPAIARLVQIYGLYASAKMAGDIVWGSFPDYKKLIHPGRRGDLERIWKMRRDATSLYLETTPVEHLVAGLLHALKAPVALRPTADSRSERRKKRKAES